jgi:hypothetical protein
VGDRCPGKPPVTGGTSPFDALEADEAGADPQQGCRRLPASRVIAPRACCSWMSS